MRVQRFVQAVAFVCAAASTTSALSASIDEPLRVYLDADQTNAVRAGEAIEAGIAAALELAGGGVTIGEQTWPIELVSLDHRGNIKRSYRNMKTFANDQQALALFTGLHSPPVLRYRDWLNEQGLLTLDPWAAAGPITRGETETNWIFRLSVDDSNAGVFIAKSVIDDGAKQPVLFLEDTGWGKNNERTMVETLAHHLGEEPAIRWFRWGVSEDAFRVMVREVLAEGADSIIFVGNTPEGAPLIRVLGEVPEEERPTLYSHWGITGGSLLEQVPESMIRAVDVRFIQTRFSIEPEDRDALVWRAFEAAQRQGYFEGLESPRWIAAPTGFVHAFDLTRVLLAAIDQAGISGTLENDRAAVQRALESLQSPVEGIIKTYQRPFRVYSDLDTDAHDALGTDDYVMSHYAADGTIEPVESVQPQPDVPVASVGMDLDTED